MSTRDPPEAKAIGLSCLAPLGTPIGHGLLVVPYFSYWAFGPDGDGTFALQSWADAFVDPALPACYGPLGIQAIGGRLFMTLAKQNPPSHDEMAGEGLGVVDEFIMNGDSIRPSGHARTAECSMGRGHGTSRLRSVPRAPTCPC